jgi:ketosteroid isomerase-like protein
VNARPAAVAAWLVFASCAATRGDAAGDRAAIDAVLRGYETAYNAHDSVALAALHAEDGGYYVPGGEPIRGRPALAAFWARSAGSGLVLTLEASDVDGRVGWAVGRWRTGEGATASHGRFVLGLRRGDRGNFEIVVDLNNEARR